MRAQTKTEAVIVWSAQSRGQRRRLHSMLSGSRGRVGCCRYCPWWWSKGVLSAHVEVKQHAALKLVIKVGFG